MGGGFVPSGSGGSVAVGAYHAAARPVVARLPVRLARRPDVLAGREGLLGRLDACCPGRRAAGGGAVRAGRGGQDQRGGGVRAPAPGRGRLAWQVAAEESAVLAAGLAELAAQLGDREVLDPRDPVASLHAVLAAMPGSWLLVLDNAADEASVRRFLSPAGDGRVLVTSQSRHWRAGQVPDVPVLEEQVAAGFLVNRAGGARAGPGPDREDHRSLYGIQEADSAEAYVAAAIQGGRRRGAGAVVFVVVSCGRPSRAACGSRRGR